MNKPDQGPAIIIPVYNHASTLDRVVNKAALLGWPIFVVDDGSTDGPLFKFGAPNITVISHDQNLGKGAALMTGFRAAAGVADWAVTLDADGQHNPNDAHGLIEAVKPGSRPLVIGCRKGMASDHVPPTSRWGREFSNFWVWLSSGKRLKDSQSGFRLYPLPEIIDLNPKTRRYQFEVEIIALAAWSGMEIAEAPVGVVYQNKGERISHFRPWLDFWRNSLTFTRLITRRIVDSVFRGASQA